MKDTGRFVVQVALALLLLAGVVGGPFYIVNVIQHSSFKPIEDLTITTLRQLVAIERDVMKNAMFDADGDGRGEAAFLSELQSHSLLPSDLASIGQGMFVSWGYTFCILMQSPHNDKGELVWSNYDRSSLLVDEAEVHWLCFAWPMHSKVGSGRAFVATPDQILETENVLKPGGELVYVGDRVPPPVENFYLIGFTVRIDGLDWVPIK